MNRLFNTFFDESTPTAARGAPGRRWIPAMDLVETCGHYVLQAVLPGLAGEDLTIQLEDNVLTISGEREAEHAQHQEVYDRLEHALGGFSPLPHAPGRIEPRKAWRPTSIDACWRSELPSLSRRSDGRSRSALGARPSDSNTVESTEPDRPARQQPRPGRWAGLTQLPSPNPPVRPRGPRTAASQHSPRSAIPPAAGRRTVGPSA